MNPIDQLADERDKLRVKLRQAKAKLRPAKSLAFALAVERERALQTVERANAANIRARAMICDAAGIPHDADILAWISGARERIARMEEAGDMMAGRLSILAEFRRDETMVENWNISKTSLKETKP